MRIFIKILLLPVKLVILILMLLLKIIYGIGWLVVHIGGRIAAPLMTFVLICGIWSAVQTNWFHVGLLTGIGALLLQSSLQRSDRPLAHAAAACTAVSVPGSTQNR